MSASGKTIRFEDLGEPVQRLLKGLKGGVTEEDMALLEYVAVKDMKIIYEKMSSDAHATEIWEELRSTLQSRKDKAERKNKELDKRQEDIDAQYEEQRKQEEEERLRQEQEEEDRRLRKEERRRKREEARAAEEAAEEEAEAQAAAEAAEAEALAEEEAEAKRREAKRKKREARARELEEEKEALRQEQERAGKKKNQKKEWDEYVASHPLDFAPQTVSEIKQVETERMGPKNTVQADEDLLNRSYTPKCPNCAAKFSRPPTEWDCPICFRRTRQRHKVWQPDSEAPNCMCCKASVGRFSRHHCRNCGRVVCGGCSALKAVIPAIGYKDSPVKVCNDCVRELGKEVPV